MKRIFITLLAVAAAIGVNAQQQKLDTASQKEPQNCAPALTKKATSLKDKAEIEQLFVKCMLEVAQEDFAGVFEAEDANKFGEELGKQLAKDLLTINCDVFIKVAMALASEETNSEDAEKSKVTEGTVLRVEESEFVHVTIKTKTNRELRFVYFNHVPDSDSWIKNPGILKGKNVKLEWNENEVYQPKAKEFVNLKQIKKLSIL